MALVKLPQTRLGKAAGAVAAVVAVATAVGGCVKSWREAAATKQLAMDEPKALRAYEALAEQVKDLKAEMKQLRDSQVKFAGYFEGYLMARGATELPSKELSVPDVKPEPSAAPASSSRPHPVASAKPFGHPPNLFILPPVPRPAASSQAMQAPPAPADLGWE